MLVVMKNDATEAQVQAVIGEIENMGYRGVPMPGAQRTAICIVGNQGPVDATQLPPFALAASPERAARGSSSPRRASTWSRSSGH